MEPSDAGVPSTSDRSPDGRIDVTVFDDHVLLMVVDRVEKRNAFTPTMLLALAQAMTRLDDDPDLWVGVLGFAGDHSTAGLDMARFFGSDADSGLGVPDDLVDPLALARRVTKPVVTAVQGLTYTIGIELALAGDIVVAADDARFCQLEPKRGLTALGGATFRFVDRGGWGNAMYHLLRADVFDAAEAYRIGIVQEVVPAGTQLDRALELAAELAQNAPIAMNLTKANARRYVDEGEPAAIAALPDVRQAFSGTADLAEGVASFVERRPARFTGR
jgi:enoyl-CoA hydratase/carnithine racemase